MATDDVGCAVAVHLRDVAQAQARPVVGPAMAEHLVVEEVVRQPADLLPEQAQEEGAADLHEHRPCVSAPQPAASGPPKLQFLWRVECWGGEGHSRYKTAANENCCNGGRLVVAIIRLNCFCWMCGYVAF